MQQKKLPPISIHIDVGQCLMAIAAILNALSHWPA